MGRWGTGAITTGQCNTIHIAAFTKHIRKGNFNFQGSIDWSNGASITVYLIKDDSRYVAILSYTKTDNEGTKRSIEYKVPIVSVPSNLGSGEVYYFLCPFSKRRCKTLYMGYGSLYFKSREAYNNRIYYATQIRSKLDRHNSRYHDLDRKLEGLAKKHPKSHYRGKLTKAQLRINRLKEEKEYHDEMRWQVLPKAISKLMGLQGIIEARELF